MSTYSPDLRIELITTGDQAGTWGTTTNTNLGTIIEDAISGYVTVSVIASSQAFTALNGTADQARNAMIRLTTTTGAAFSVYAPPSSKQYIIWNNSGYTATIYNSTVIGNTTAAGTGVAIANGDKLVVFTDGTNFYEIKSNNVTGTVAIANGGTGQTTANAAFNALVPSQASASGKYLKSDGTNTSWDAIDVGTADVTGTLSPANGGTGVANNVASTVTITGAYSLAWTLSGATSLTLPTSGTVTTIAGTQTLTNKRIDPRVSSTTSTSSITPDVASYDQYCLTAQAATLTINAPTGTPVDGTKLIFRILDNGVSQTLTWNGTYTVIGVTLPTSTVASKTTYVGCVYNAANTRWDVIAVTTQV